MTSAAASPASLRARLVSKLPPEARDVIARIISAAVPRHVYAVGGVVRDLLIGRATVDIDLAIEGDAIAIMRDALPGARITAHARFRTARVTAGTASIDAVTARGETYVRPGALPVIRPASIDEDLRRRDFSINAIAIRLDGEAALVDPCGGVDDVHAGRVRVLHARSFIDDPTRIYRAVRYAARLHFIIESETASLLRRDLQYVAALSAARVRHELELLLLEAEAGGALLAAAEAGALRAAHPALAWDADRAEVFGHPGMPVVPRLPLGFALLAAGASAAEAEAICQRLRLTRAEAAAVRAMPALHALDATLRRPNAKPSGVVMLLEKHPVAAVAAYAATARDTIARQLALRYLEEWRHVKPLLRGDDLAALGVPAGPQIERGLQLIRAARLDGLADDEGDERALALRFARSVRDANAAHGEVTLYPNGH
jgi:tRNA nucleotidyltransferase (CCA-adding enzyme)